MDRYTNDDENRGATSIAYHQDALEGDQASPFLDALFAGKPDDAFILIWTKELKHSQWFTDAQTAADYVHSMSHGDVYVGCGLSPADYGAHKRCSAANIAATVGLWADVDFSTNGHNGKVYPPSEAAARQIVESMPLLPTLIVHSGHGLHCWWLFHEPWTFDTEEERAAAESVVNRWGTLVKTRANALGYSLDSVFDLARVLRVPGTFNTKSQPPVPVRILELHQERRYSLDEIEQILPTNDAVTPGPTSAIDVNGLIFDHNAEPPADRINELCSQHSAFRDTWNHKRQNLKDSSASGYSMALTHYLVADGWPDQDIVDAVIAWRRRHDPEGETKADRPRWFADMISKVRASVGRKFGIIDMVRETRDRQVVFDHICELAELSAPDYARVRSELKDILKSDLNLSDLDRARNELRREAQEQADVGLTKQLADAIRTENHFAQDDGGALYVFTAGRYIPKGEEFVKRQVQRTLEDWQLSSKWTTRRAKEVIEYIRIPSPSLWDRPPTNRLNVRNGILDIETLTLYEHSPDHLSVVQLPIWYDPEASCPEWDQFIASTFPPDARRLAFEVIADAMTPDRSHQQAILCMGQGSNGKTTFLKALSSFLGAENVSNVSLQELEENRFSRALIVGKLANICADLPNVKLRDTFMLKSITGGDAITVEEKFRAGYSYKPFVRLIFASNSFPQSDDTSHAFYRRWMILPFDRTFTEGGRDFVPATELDARLADPKELSGVLNRALEVLPDLRRNGFTHPESLRAALHEFRVSTDPFAEWLDCHTRLKSDVFVTKDNLRKAYADDCIQNGRPIMREGSFTQALERLRPSVVRGQRNVNGERKWVYVGIDLRED